MVEIILEILKFTIPALIVGSIFLIMLKMHFDKEKQVKLLELKSASTKDALPLQMQAYERLSLFVHRIAPENMLPRIQNTSLSVDAYKKMIVQNIKSEFEHNITQQIYVTDKVWKSVMLYKNDVVNVVVNSAKTLDGKSNSFELSKAILEYYMNNEQAVNSEKVMRVINQELKKLFL